MSLFISDFQVIWHKVLYITIKKNSKNIPGKCPNKKEKNYKKPVRYKIKMFIKNKNIKKLHKKWANYKWH